ncbi:MAG TPA: O-antigen ligase family protein [Bauldia sp.]|nr:O-antigen ligase family protein [Bauldia sp.]
MTTAVAAGSETVAGEQPAALADAAVARRGSAAAARLLHAIATIVCIALIVLPILSDDTVREFPTLAHRLGYVLFENWWKFFSPADEASARLRFNTIEALLVLGALATLGWMWAERRRPTVTADMLVAIGFVGVVLLMFAAGLATGGAIKPALWQVRPYFQIAALAILLTQVVRNDADLRLTLGAMIAAILVKAVFTVWVFFALAHAHFSGWRELVGHEDSIFFDAAFFFLLALALYDRRLRTSVLALLAGALLLAALVLNLRRAGYAAFGMSALLLPFILVDKRRLAAGLLALAAAGGALYLALFWDNSGPLGVPAEKVRSIFAASDDGDYTSNIYRDGENLNLWTMVREHPLGTGFGKPFEKVFPVADLSSILPYWDYDPHNALFGLWMALGTPAFVVCIWLFAVPIASASLAMRRSTKAFVRASAIFCVLGLSAALLASNLDQFVWAQRGAIFVGALLGFVSAIGALQRRVSADAASAR